MCSPPRGAGPKRGERERAWPAKQSAEIAALYHEAASYRSGPFREAEAGGALAYVERQFAVEEGGGMPVCRAHRGGRPSHGRVASLKLWLEHGVEGDLM